MLKRILALVLLGSVMALAQAAEPAGKLTAENIIKRTARGPAERSHIVSKR